MPTRKVQPPSKAMSDAAQELVWARDNRLWFRMNGELFRSEADGTHPKKFFVKYAQGFPSNLVVTPQGDVLFFRDTLNGHTPALVLMRVARPANAAKKPQFQEVCALSSLIAPDDQTSDRPDWLESFSLSPDAKTLLFAVRHEGSLQIYVALNAT